MISNLSIEEVFTEDGVALLPSFYNYENEIAPIQAGIRNIVELVARQVGLNVPCGTPEDAMTRGYSALIKHDRKLGGVVYDAVKQIPEFMALVANRRNAELFMRVRPGSIPGVAAGGYGIRIDNPGEEKFRTFWHQEFPAQLRSIDGIVLWSPLLPVTQDMGPVEMARGSHRGGLISVVVDDGGAGRTGAYAMRLEGEEERVARYERISPLTKPGDLVIMDFLTLHQSGRNTSDRPRWSMQLRYFNFADPVGMSIKWAGAFAQGKSITQIFEDIKKVQSEAA